MLKCNSNSEYGIRCWLAARHEGPHRNANGEGPAMEWSNLGNGRCLASAPHSSAICHRDKGHDGPHVDGAISWGF